MNKLLLLGLISACLIVITQGSEQVEETNVAHLDSESAALRETREADPKKKNRGNKGGKKKNKASRKAKKKGKNARKDKKKGRKGAKKTRNGKSKAKKGKKKGRKVAKKTKKGKKGKKKSRKMKKKSKKGRKGKKGKKGKKNSRKQKKKSRKTNKKSRKQKGNKKKGRKIQGRAETCMNETCINTAMSYMKIMKDKVSNFLRQKTRVSKYSTTSSNKHGKKGLFGPILNRIREAGGGNSSNLKCNGDNSSAGAKQLANLTALLGACEDNINASCSANQPSINQTEHDLCEAAMTAFADGTKECQKKTGAEACACWTNSTLETQVAEVKKCDISDDNKAMTKAKKQCTSAFGKCRKVEDSVSESLSACSPANTKSRATADIKQGLKNKAAVKKATEKINSTASSSTSRQAASITCAVFTTNVISATAEILRAPLLKGVETVLLALASATVATCSSAEKTNLLSLSVNMTNTAVNIDLNIEHKQLDLQISQGSTVSTSAVQAIIEAEASATTAAPATVSAVSMTMTTASPSKRRMFKASKVRGW